jgi:hypothetical protein
MGVIKTLNNLDGSRAYRLKTALFMLFLSLDKYFS